MNMNSSSAGGSNETLREYGVANNRYSKNAAAELTREEPKVNSAAFCH